MTLDAATSGHYFLLMIYALTAICFLNLFLQNSIQLLQLVVAGLKFSKRGSRLKRQNLWRQCQDSALPVSLIAPVFNEEELIIDSILALCMLEYPDHEVIVVNDGSEDGTLEALIEEFDLEPFSRQPLSHLDHTPWRGIYRSLRFGNLVIIDKPRGGKADAINTGLNVAKNPLVAVVDGDSVLEGDSLLRVMQLFLEEPEDLAAVGGTVRVLNGCEIENGRISNVGLSRNLLALLQTIEYLRSFLVARLAWSELGALTIISGAFGVFRKDVLLEVGGYSSDTVGEDFEIIMKIHEHAGLKGRTNLVRFIPDPVCWTRVPSNIRQLSAQRARWQRGALETYFKYRKMFGQSRFGAVGSLGLSNMMITDVVGPILEVLGYILVPISWACGWLSSEIALAFWATMFFFGVFISVTSLVLEEAELNRYPKSKQLLMLGATAVLENFGYRQMSNLFRVRGYIQYLRGSKAW